MVCVCIYEWAAGIRHNVYGGSQCMCVYMHDVRGRERERQRERKGVRERVRKREKERERESEKEREGERERETEREPYFPLKF